MVLVVPPLRRKHAAIPLVATLAPFCAGVLKLTRLLFLKFNEVAVLEKLIQVLPKVVAEELEAFK